MIPTEALLLVAIIPLLVSIVLMRIANKRETADAQTALDANSKEAGPAAAQPSIWGGAKMVMFSKFLLFAALVTMLTNWVNTNGENLLFGVIQDALAADAEKQGITGDDSVLEFVRNGTTSFYGNFFFWVNIVYITL